MGDHLGVGGGLENGARPLQFLPQASRVHQVAVGRQGQGPEGIVENQGLGVEEAALPGGGVADVADGGVPRQFSQPVVIKHFRHQPHSAVVPESPPVGGGAAGAFLSPVLQRVQPVIGEPDRLRMAGDAEHPAFFLQFVEDGFIAHGIAPSHTSESSPTPASITSRPFRRTRSRPSVTRPIRSKGTPRSRKKCSSSSAASGEALRSTRDWLSLKRKAMADRSVRTSISAPRPPPMQDSASATASPPSDRSWADETQPLRIASSTAS